MVKKWVCLSFFLMASLLFSNDVTVHVEVQEQLAVANRPVMALLCVEGENLSKEDIVSAEIDGTPVSLQLYGQQSGSYRVHENGQVKSLQKNLYSYLFQIAPQKAGEHTLPEVALKVGGVTYTAPSVKFLVSELDELDSLTLKAVIEAPKSLYSGQSFNVLYRLKSPKRFHIDFHHLPLLELDGFKKRGQLKERSFFNGGQYVSEFSREYEAQDAGTFEVEDSFIEGRYFNQDVFGRKSFQREAGRVSCKKAEVIVSPFPEGAPSSFNGSLGRFSVEASIVGSNQVCIGDKLKLQIRLKGEGAHFKAKTPSFLKQAGFSGDFKTNDLPLVDESSSHEKTFVYQLRPMKEGLTQIPPIEFSSFDVEKKQYCTHTSPAIPLVVLPAQQKSEPITPIFDLQEPQPTIESPISSQWVEEKLADPIEIMGNSTFENPKIPKGTHSIEWGGFLMALLVIQWLLKRRSTSHSKRVESQKILAQAFKSNLNRYPLLIEKALNKRCEELGIEHRKSHVEVFIQELNHQLFANTDHFLLPDHHVKAQHLYDQIGEVE